MENPLQALPLASRQLVTQAVLPETWLDGCWVVRASVEDAKGIAHAVNLVVARIAFDQLPAGAADEDRVAARLADAVAAVTLPNEQCRVHTVFSREPLNPHLLARLSAVPGSCLREPISAINTDIVKIDSL
jgi:hypothetical protein